MTGAARLERAARAAAHAGEKRGSSGEGKGGTAICAGPRHIATGSAIHRYDRGRIGGARVGSRGILRGPCVARWICISRVGARDGQGRTQDHRALAPSASTCGSTKGARPLRMNVPEAAGTRAKGRH